MSRSLEGWLAYAEHTHFKSIDMGLERVRSVGERLGVVPFPLPSVIVAGTNGKGSTVALIDGLIRGHGYRSGATFSPHLEHFNERVVIDGHTASDALLCEAFEAVEDARGDTPLTYFEYATLVALWCFVRCKLDYAVLEVGLGGRLDAFNIVDASVAVVVSIGLDHQEFLGDTVELIGAEKAGVFRPQQPVVLGRDLPDSVTQRAMALDCRLAVWGQHFSVADGVLQPINLADEYRLGEPVALADGLPEHNQALATVATAALLDVDPEAARDALGGVALPGRFERVRACDRDWILDVAHNPHGARFLQATLASAGEQPVVAVYGAYADKPVADVVAELANVDRWITTSTDGPRGMGGRTCAERIARGEAYDLPGEAFKAACSASQPGDVILVFGSFAVVEAARRWMRSCATG